MAMLNSQMVYHLETIMKWDLFICNWLTIPLITDISPAKTIVKWDKFICTNQSRWIAHWGTTLHWPFQEPKLEVPTIYKAYWPKFQGISPQNMAKHMVRLRSSILGSWNSHWIYIHLYIYILSTWGCIPASVFSRYCWLSGAVMPNCMEHLRQLQPDEEVPVNWTWVWDVGPRGPSPWKWWIARTMWGPPVMFVG